MVEHRSNVNAEIWQEAPARPLWAQLALAWGLAIVVSFAASAIGAWIGG